MELVNSRESKWNDPEEILQYRHKGVEVVVKDEWTVCD